MKKTIVSFTLGLVVGAIAVGTWSQMDMMEALEMQREAELAKRVLRCQQAYFAENMPVALWELDNLLSALNDQMALATNEEKTRRIRYWLFITHGRLARLLRESDQLGAAEAQGELAIACGDLFPEATNLVSLLGVIEKLDVVRKGDIEKGHPISVSGQSPSRK